MPDPFISIPVHTMATKLYLRQCSYHYATPKNGKNAGKMQKGKRIRSKGLRRKNAVSFIPKYLFQLHFVIKHKYLAYL